MQGPKGSPPPGSRITMPRMESAIPQRLRALIEDSAAADPTLEFVECCDRILADNKMPFFPAYTDHGTSHVGSVLAAGERLVPDAVWREELLAPEDAVVLTAASFLHDLGLHLQEAGFLALIGDRSQHKPLPWFDEEQGERPADLPWQELWQSFRREARRFSQSQLDLILGPGYGDAPQIVFGDLDTEPSEWTFNDRLLVGEFLRRHHARLAHEIAIYGFPGIAAEEFPVLGRTLSALAESIGATARSHSEDMRTMAEYLECRGKGDLRPDGVVQLYLMGVLRISDYFQLEAKRATPLLLHLREPQSPASVEEWEKHQAISSISWDHRDPRAVSIQVSPNHNLRTHLQLGDLVADLQSELDLTSAVLSETYGASKLPTLQLDLQRVRTNLHAADLHRRLPFVPRRARMRSAEDLFRLVVDDLYGNEPAVAGRELLQNAIDAVRERERWETQRGERLSRDDFRDQAADVVVETRELDDNLGLLRISDRGIGMSVSTVIDGFLAAGATFSPSASEDQETGIPLKWMKAGRFGIGVFAAFLLGDLIQVTTRHPGEEKGLTFIAGMGDDLVQLDWLEDAPLGTEIVVPFLSENLPEVTRWLGKEERKNASHRHLLAQIQSFFVLQRPRIDFLLKAQDGTSEEKQQLGEVPDPNGQLPDRWRAIEAPGFDAVLWSLPTRTIGGSLFAPWNANGNEVAHNGILVRRPEREHGDRVYRWTSPLTNDILNPPSLAVFDTRQELRLALNRYELADSSVPFETQLQRSIGCDLVAHALACGESPHPLAADWGLQPIYSRKGWIPLLPSLVQRHIDRDLCVLLIDAPEHQEVAKRFLKGQTKGGQWRQIPYRTALEPFDIFNDDELEEFEWKRDDSVHRDRAEKEVTRSIDELTRLCDLIPTTGVLVRPHSPTPITTLYEDQDEPPNAALANMAKELNESCEIRAEFFSLITLRDWKYDDFEEIGEPPEPWLEPLAESWEEILGGMLERSPKARAQRRQAITGENKQMRDLVERWERFSKSPKWP
jgi:molecular chaperone HtpG